MTSETLDQARERLRPYVERAKTFTGWMAYVHIGDLVLDIRGITWPAPMS